MLYLPVIDKVATGKNILRLRQERGLSVRDLQELLSLDEPRSIYQWQSGQRLASVPHLYALSYLLDAPLEEILVSVKGKLIIEGGKASQEEPIVFCNLIWCSTMQTYIPSRISIPMIIGYHA